MTVQLYKVLLLTCVVNCTAGMPMLVVSALGSKSDNPGSSPGRDKLCGGKKIKAPLLGLAKCMYYFDFINKEE